MSKTVPATETDALRATLKSQYHAALAMLRHAIERCPEEAWTSTAHTNAPWQIAYHTLYFTHLYSCTDEAAFRPWEKHRAENQYPDAIAGSPDPDSPLPLIPDPYTRAEVLEYWTACDAMIDGAVDRMDIHAPESGFSWYRVSKLEHQLINIRHIQHGAAQLADRVRAAAHVGIDWVGARRR